MRPVLIRGLTAAAATSLVAGLGIFAATSASAAAGCRVDYSVNQWNTGFTANMTVTNLGDPISGGWNVTWTFPGNQTITQGWSATITQSGQHVTAKNPDWAKGLATGGSHSLGFQASFSGTNDKPSSFGRRMSVSNTSIWIDFIVARACSPSPTTCTSWPASRNTSAPAR